MKTYAAYVMISRMSMSSLSPIIGSEPSGFIHIMSTIAILWIFFLIHGSISMPCISEKRSTSR